MKKINILLIVVMAFFVFSCSKWLDVAPKTEKSKEVTFESYRGFKDALTACYIKLNHRDLYGGNLIYNKIECLAQLWPTSDRYREEEYYLQRFDYKNEKVEPILKSIYGKLYNIICQANLVIDAIETNGNVIPDPKMKDLIKGEAHAIRAFCHFEVLRLFGQLPVNSTMNVSLPYAETVSYELVQQHNYNEYCAKIERDYIIAEESLKDSDPLFEYTFTQLNRHESSDLTKIILNDLFKGYRQFRFNYYGVKALKARYYLYVGKKSNAYDEAKTVYLAKNTDGTPLVKLAGQGDFQKSNFNLPSECIMALTNYKMIDYSADVLGIPGESFILEHHLTDAKLYELFSDCNIATNNRYQYVWNTGTGTSGNIMNTIKKYYYDPDAKLSTVEFVTEKQIVPIIRLSEIYLILIETSTSNAEKNLLFRDYMIARGEIVSNDLTDEEFSLKVVNEYRRELFCEGQMFYLYKRLGAKRMMWREDEVKEEDYILPIPKTEFNFYN